MSEIKDIDKSLTKKDLIDYVFKINEREMMKQQRNGLTFWALLGSMVAISYQSIDLLPIIIDNDNKVILLFFVTTLLNLFLPLFRLILDFIDLPKRDYIINFLNQNNFFKHETLKMIFMSILFQLNLIIALGMIEFRGLIELQIIRFIYGGFSIAYFIIAFSQPIRGFKFWVQKKYYGIQANWIDYPSFNLDAFWIFSITYAKKIIISLFFVCMSGFTLFFINYKTIYENNDCFKLFKLSFFIIAFLLIALLLFKQFQSKSKNKYLQEIESDLILSDYTYEETKWIIKKFFYDQSIFDWLDEQVSELKENHNRIMKAMEEIQTSINDDVEADIFVKEMAFKIRKIEFAQEKYKKYIKKLINNINMMQKQSNPYNGEISEMEITVDKLINLESDTEVERVLNNINLKVKELMDKTNNRNILS